MKKMTKKEFLDSKVGEFFKLNTKEDTILVKNAPKWFCPLSDLKIELTPDKPPITIENLGRFMAKFGEYPSAKMTLRKDDNSEILVVYTLLATVKENLYTNSMCENYHECEVIDDRWTFENLGGEG